MDLEEVGDVAAAGILEVEEDGAGSGRHGGRGELRIIAYAPIVERLYHTGRGYHVFKQCARSAVHP